MLKEIMKSVQVGESFTIQKKIDKTDTALNYGSGKLDNLLATPSLVALMIEGAVKMLDAKLPEGFVTVGITSNIEHEEPTVLGATVSVQITCVNFDGKRIVLEMAAFDEIGEIGRGSHERIIVNKEALIRKANERAGNIVKRF